MNYRKIFQGDKIFPKMFGSKDFVKRLGLNRLFVKFARQTMDYIPGIIQHHESIEFGIDGILELRILRHEETRFFDVDITTWRTYRDMKKKPIPWSEIQAELSE